MGRHIHKEKYPQSLISSFSSPCVFLETGSAAQSSAAVCSDAKKRSQHFLRQKNQVRCDDCFSVQQENTSSFLFKNFSRVLAFYHGDDPDRFLKSIEAYSRKGFWLSGFFSYEWGYYLEPALFPLQKKSNIPLVWLGVSDKPFIIPPHETVFSGRDKNNSFAITNIQVNNSFRHYADVITEIKKYLKQGLTYQVNYTFKLTFDFRGDAVDLYCALRKSQPTAYMSFINTGHEHVLSFSPELFFRSNQKQIITRPMKGTIQRGKYKNEDRYYKTCLTDNKKVKAENIMIVDLLRNDLGRIAEKVRVPQLFRVERYPTLYQLTSTIQADLRKDVSIKDIFRALFPCGSVTGAPKIKTMELISHLEKEPRGVYTGAIGYISPYQQACFNVAIRTAVIKNGKGELGIGGGIVSDSQSRSEFNEALLKSKFFLNVIPRVSLFESIAWEKNKGFFFLPGHLRRLKASARYFSIPLDIKDIQKKLKAAVKNAVQGKYKVKIIVSQGGNVTIEKEILETMTGPVQVNLNSCVINQSDIYLYHKTTRRDLYDEERRKIVKQGFFETIFFNKSQEVTEGTISNIFVEKQGVLYTPPVSCGLLNGVLRQYLLKKGKVRERILYREDLFRADKLYIGNSVRGLLEARGFRGSPGKNS